MDYLASKTQSTSYHSVHDDLGERPLLSRSKSESRSIASTLYDGAGYTDNANTKASDITVELAPIKTNASERGSHDLFCEVIGKSPTSPGYSPSSAGSNNGSLKHSFANLQSPDAHALYPRILKAYHQQRNIYRAFSICTTAVIWLQLIDGAVCAALGVKMMQGPNLSVVVVVLGSLQAVLAGLLTWFNARNQPERARQHQGRLKMVLDAIDDTEAAFRMPGYAEGVQTVREKVQAIQDMYREIERDNMAVVIKPADHS